MSELRWAYPLLSTISLLSFLDIFLMLLVYYYRADEKEVYYLIKIKAKLANRQSSVSTSGNFLSSMSETWTQTQYLYLQQLPVIAFLIVFVPNLPPFAKYEWLKYFLFVSCSTLYRNINISRSNFLVSRTCESHLLVGGNFKTRCLSCNHMLRGSKISRISSMQSNGYVTRREYGPGERDDHDSEKGNVVGWAMVPMNSTSSVFG